MLLLKRSTSPKLPSPDWLYTSCLLLIGLQKHTQAPRYAQISGGVVVLTVGAFVYDRVLEGEEVGPFPCPRFPTTHGTSRCSCCGLHVVHTARKESAAGELALAIVIPQFSS